MYRAPVPVLSESTTTGTAVARLNRCAVTWRVVIQQLDILETMSPLDFLDFRDFLFPASGFQSVQFRLIENKLGLQRSQRLNYNKSEYTLPLSQTHQEVVAACEQEDSLFTLIERWLERTPFLEFEDYNFWEAYQQCVKDVLADDRKTITVPLASL